MAFDWFYNIKLSTMGIFSIVFTTIGLISVVIMIASQYRLTYIAKNNTKENEKLIAITVTPKTIKQLEKQINISIWVSAINLLLAMICIILFIKYNRIALDCGAYKHVQLSQTLQEIIDCEKVGYKESENIPDDLKGAIIIYFKYGCPDCGDIHNDLMAYIDNNPIDNLYFVSTRSEKGIQLMKKYPVAEIPAAIYIRQKDSKISDIYQEKIYIEGNRDVGIKATFNQDALEFLIARQKDGE